MYVFLTLFSIAFGVTILSYLFFREISQRLKRLGPHQKPLMNSWLQLKDIRVSTDRCKTYERILPSATLGQSSLSP